MAQIKWTEPALEDLNDIAEYIALDKPVAAKKLVQKIFKSVKRLKDFPKSGKVPDDLRDSRYREIVVGPCRVFYRVEPNTVFILYVMRSERALRNFILEDRANDS
ncbi:type II toxin-antitoxin system RelE/ParE family toxin [Pleionea mediterranea]|jgi:toxin ParE1/3/4|uniref:Toxin ParE1/3/4 n=1 Tax=Pleionea mediterranea TaxID=523701 RepID=A0A316FIR1_9GAMM|nr:type II toxin-antitoxin system RelE/ParE family toxin [Pleionea mediterranea]PWK48624.1 toxin ParE1/3/4 [Pleionea mediterranea]